MSPAMQPQKDVSSEQSSVTFFRNSSFFGGGIQAPVAVMVRKDLKLVGISSTDTKIRHIVAPGKHFYVAGGEGGNIIQAALTAGKNYYVRIEPRWGVWKAQFVGIPISSTELMTDMVQKELKTSVYVASNPDTEQ